MSARSRSIFLSCFAASAICTFAAPLSAPAPDPALLSGPFPDAERGYEQGVDRPAGGFWGYTLAGGAGGSVWSHPGASPCRQPNGSNPCWEGEGVFAVAAANAAASGDDDAAFRISAFRHEGSTGALKPSAICDGDLIANSGASDGRAFFIARQMVRFDRDWLRRQGVAHWIAADGRACIPTLAHADWHYAGVCGNVIQLLANGAPPAAEAAGGTRRAEAPPVSRLPARRGAAPASLTSAGAFGGGGGGAASRAAARGVEPELGVAVFVDPSPTLVSGAGDRGAPTPPVAGSPALVAAMDPGDPPDGPASAPPWDPPAVDDEPAPPAIPLPPTFVALLGAIGILCFFQATRGEYLRE